jgi:hypothetical protein
MKWQYIASVIVGLSLALVLLAILLRSRRARHKDPTVITKSELTTSDLVEWFRREGPGGDQ